MDTFGFPAYQSGSVPTARMDIGYLLMKDGHGFLIIHGDGRLFTMVAGFTIPITGGYGCRIMNGARAGYRGEDLTIITDGRR